MRLAYVLVIGGSGGWVRGGCGDSKKVKSDAAADAATTEAGVDTGGGDAAGAEAAADAAVAPKLSNVAAAMVPTAGIGDCVVPPPTAR